MPQSPGGLLPPDAPSDSLEGVLERIVYANDETGWSVIRLAPGDGTSGVTAVGSLSGVRPGETLRLAGRWIEDRKFGRQFEFDSYLTLQPDTVAGIERFLASGLIRGIGPAMAKRLVERFGIETLAVIEQHPHRLREVSGIGRVRSASIQEAFLEHRQIQDVMVLLHSFGLSTRFALKIHKRYGAAAAGIVRENPYRLARDIQGIGFKSADSIALQLGLSKDAPQRAEAALHHVLERAGENGHLYLERRELVAQTAALLDVDEAVAAEALVALERRREVRTDAGTESLPTDPIYLHELYAAELGIAHHVLRLLTRETDPLDVNGPRALEWLERRARMQLAERQRAAIEAGFHEKILVVTGGPGTGKTTLVRGFVEVLDRKGLAIELAAPTGRAAKRLGEATGHEARTVHRLLEFDPRSGRFQRNADQPIDADMLIVDEASMLDAVMTNHLLAAMPDACRLVLVGDVDQLPSVGPGRVLEDLIESEVVGVVRLTEIFRQAERSRIVLNAHRVNHGEMPDVEAAGTRSDFFFLEREDPDEALATVKLLVGERLAGGFGFNPMDDIQVLSPMRRGTLGTHRLNEEIQDLLNPDGTAIGEGSRGLRIGDRVMQIRNNYDLGVFNGDIGRVEAINRTDQLVHVQFDGRRVTYERSDLDELVLAYCCSVHKSQGSEYPCVVLPLHTQHTVMLQRNLLYTAITRARRVLVIVGSRRALRLAVTNFRHERRNSRLAGRLRAALAGAASQ